MRCCGWQGAPGACWVHIRPRVPASGGSRGVREALGGVTGLPVLLPCLAPSHACPFALPWEEVAGWSGGGSHSYEATQALSAKGISGAGEGTCRRGCGEGGVRSVRLLCLLPTAPKQGRLHQPLPAESREEVVLSHPGLCHFSETSTPLNPGPWGERSAGRPPKEGSSADGGILWAPNLLQRGCQVGGSLLHGLY